MFSGLPNQLKYIQIKLSPQEYLLVCKIPCFVCAASFSSLPPFLKIGAANFVLPSNTSPFLWRLFGVFIHKSLLEKTVSVASAGSQQMDLEGPFLHGFYISDEFCFKVCCYPKRSWSRSPPSPVIFYNREDWFQHIGIPPYFLSSLMGLLDSF